MDRGPLPRSLLSSVCRNAIGRWKQASKDVESIAYRRYSLRSCTVCDRASIRRLIPHQDLYRAGVPVASIEATYHREACGRLRALETTRVLRLLWSPSQPTISNLTCRHGQYFMAASVHSRYRNHQLTMDSSLHCVRSRSLRSRPLVG
jgi:hypothetical protein